MDTLCSWQHEHTLFSVDKHECTLLHSVDKYEHTLLCVDKHEWHSHLCSVDNMNLLSLFVDKHEWTLHSVDRHEHTLYSVDKHEWILFCWQSEHTLFSSSVDKLERTLRSVDKHEHTISSVDKDEHCVFMTAGLEPLEAYHIVLHHSVAQLCRHTVPDPRHRQQKKTVTGFSTHHFSLIIHINRRATLITMRTQGFKDGMNFHKSLKLMQFIPPPPHTHTFYTLLHECLHL